MHVLTASKPCAWLSSLLLVVLKIWFDSYVPIYSHMFVLIIVYLVERFEFAYVLIILQLCVAVLVAIVLIASAVQDGFCIACTSSCLPHSFFIGFWSAQSESMAMPRTHSECANAQNMIGWVICIYMYIYIYIYIYVHTNICIYVFKFLGTRHIQARGHPRHRHSLPRGFWALNRHPF